MESLEDLVSYQKQLDQEEEFLIKLIAQIDKQINCLQVEQMQLQTAELESKCSRQVPTKPKTDVSAEGTKEQLILSVPMKSSLGDESYEEEDEEDC